MANRCYLYSTDILPGSNSDHKKLVGITEWKYEIPLVFKILISGHSQACKSSIWDLDENIALVGDYELGLDRLNTFLSKIDNPDAKKLISEALDFLTLSENKNQYFVLEAGEIFDMEDSPLHEQNLLLLNQVNNLDAEMQAALSLVNMHSDSLDSIYGLGLGNWSNILYYDFSEQPEQEPEVESQQSASRAYPEDSMQYAGFWKRFLAYAIDIIPISLAVFGIFYFFLDFDQTLNAYMNGDRSVQVRIDFLSERNKIRDAALLVWVLYGFFMDCSKFQGTHGKMLLNLKVVNQYGEKITLIQSIQRTLMKSVGIIVIYLGCIWAAFRKDKAAWHDMFAKTRVIKR